MRAEILYGYRQALNLTAGENIRSLIMQRHTRNKRQQGGSRERLAERVNASIGILLPKKKTHVEHWIYLRLESDATTDSTCNHVNRNRPTIRDLHDYSAGVFARIA